MGALWVVVELDPQPLQVALAAHEVPLLALPSHHPLQQLLGHLHVQPQLLQLLEALHVVLPPPPGLRPVRLLPRPEHVVRVLVVRRGRSLQLSQQGLVQPGALLLPVVVNGHEHRVFGSSGPPQLVERDIPPQVDRVIAVVARRGAPRGALACLRASELELVDHELKPILVQDGPPAALDRACGRSPAAPTGVELRQPPLVVIVQVVLDLLARPGPHGGPDVSILFHEIRFVVLLVRRDGVHDRDRDLSHGLLGLLDRQDLLVLRVEGLVAVSHPSGRKAVPGVQISQISDQRQKPVDVDLPGPEAGPGRHLGYLRRDLRSITGLAGRSADVQDPVILGFRRARVCAPGLGLWIFARGAVRVFAFRRRGEL